MNLFDKKLFLYQIDPLFFYDSNNDGFGDFEGFLKKIDYFKFLNVSGVIFPDIFNQESVINKNVQTTLFDKYGKMKELKNIISYFQNENINFFVEINLNNILSSMITKTSIEDMKLKNINQFIDIRSSMDENEQIKWEASKYGDSYTKIIKFWSKMGVNNFILTNFENNNNSNHSALFEQLKYLNDVVKDMCPNSVIGIKTLYFDTKTINNIFKNYIGRICDFVIDNSYSLLGTVKKHEFEMMKKFKIKDLLNKIKKIKIDDNYKSRYIIAFNNNLIGRVNSRWLNEINLINESNKCLLSLSNSLPYSSINYWGDEIGMLRLNIKEKQDYHDYEYNEKKRKIESKKFKISDFENSQKFLSPINTQAFFVWNDQINGGFSKNKNLFRKLPINYKSHNFEIEKENEDSILNFYKKLISISNYFISSNKLSKIKMRSSKKIFTCKLNKDKMILINLSNKTINKNVNKKWKVVLSSFNNKTYDSKIKILCPFETLILELNN